MCFLCESLYKQFYQTLKVLKVNRIASVKTIFYSKPTMKPSTWNYTKIMMENRVGLSFIWMCVCVCILIPSNMHYSMPGVLFFFINEVPIRHGNPISQSILCARGKSHRRRRRRHTYWSGWSLPEKVSTNENALVGLQWSPQETCAGTKSVWGRYADSRGETWKLLRKKRPFFKNGNSSAMFFFL